VLQAEQAIAAARADKHADSLDPEHAPEMRGDPTLTLKKE